MPYSNRTKIANGATITIGATTYEDCTIIGVPGQERELIDITTLGSTRREYAASDMIDSPEFDVVMPYAGAPITTSATAESITVTLTKLGGSVDAHAFTGFIRSAVPEPAEVDGKLMYRLRIKPVTAPTIS